MQTSILSAVYSNHGLPIPIIALTGILMRPPYLFHTCMIFFSINLSNHSLFYLLIQSEHWILSLAQLSES